MVRGIEFTIDSDVIRKIDRGARRKAAKTSGGQDRFKPKVEGSRKRYSRKVKHKGVIDDR